MIHRLLATTALAGVTMLGAASPVLANPTGGSVSAGQATISSSGQTVTIQQASSKAVLNWASFNIAPGELTQFQQPSRSAIALNRINDVNPSSIEGSLTANGGVILVNPNGVIFGSGAQVNVGSLIATTSNISDNAFMNNSTLVFDQPGNPNAQVINRGAITAAQAGLVGLVVPNVENSGVITAKLGKVQLASGDTFTLDLAGDGVTQIGVSAAVLHQLVRNGGAIVADGGTVQITAAAARSAIDSLIVNTGVIQANSIEQHGGEIILSADAPGSVITNSGIISAQGTRRQSGGSVSLAASAINLGGVIDADATGGGDGGEITITATNILFEGQASVQGGPNGGNGGTITLFAPGTNAVAGNNPADKTGQATSTVEDYGLLSAAAYGPGGMGGNVSVLGDNVGIMSGAFIDASGDAGGGTVKIGGDFHGQGTTPTALNTYVDPNAWIFANAVTTGNGGNVVVWSDGRTYFLGNIIAEGGASPLPQAGEGSGVAAGEGASSLPSPASAGEGQGGGSNGGYVETSGHGYLDAEGYVDLTAPGGQKNTYLLDPATIEIYGGVTPAFNATDGSISLSSALQLWLDASNQGSITLSYNSTGTTASGSIGANTITVGSNSGLVVGERIQIGGSSDSFAASINDNASGSNVYTITAISGTTITLDANLATSPSGATLYGGFVSQINDLSSNSNNATQTTAANMPLWISNDQNGLGVAQFTQANTDALALANTVNLTSGLSIEWHLL